MTPADIARLAAVGRTAVSNWRRRYADFPQPVGGTPGSPVFALAEVEAWLRGQGKLVEVPLAERAWQELRARTGDDLRLATALAKVGESLLAGDPDLPEAVGELAASAGAAAAFEVLLGRLQDTQYRRTATTTPDIAELMAALAGAAATVLDPACGTGEILVAARDRGAASRLLGQDAADDAAHLALIRLRLGLDGADATIRTGDSLRHDAFAGVLADAVLCDPPFHERAWGNEELVRDSRWIYGLPPRLEPELAWVQHALAHLAPGGVAVVLMPAAAAGRRPGRRIRAQLLRKGALRAVVALSAAHQLWLLRRPGGPAGLAGPAAGDPPSSVLMVSSADPDTILMAWQGFSENPAHDEPGVSRAVPIIDLLDEEVNLTPALYLSVIAPDRVAERFGQARKRLAATIEELRDLLPDLRPAGEGGGAGGGGGDRGLGAVTVAELALTGHLAILSAALRKDSGPGELAMITAEDVTEGRPASGSGPGDDRSIVVRAGDIVVAAGAGRIALRVSDSEGDLLGPGLTLLRLDQRHLDPDFVAGALRSSANAQTSLTQTAGTGRVDIRRARVPVLPLAEQHRYGDVFRRMDRLESAVREAGATSAELARLLADGLTEGALEPSPEASAEASAGPSAGPSAGAAPESASGRPSWKADLGQTR